jgi:hypothetical protein
MSVSRSDVSLAPAYWPRRLTGRAAWRRHCPSGEGARHVLRQWRGFGNGLTAALDLHVLRAFTMDFTLRAHSS